MSLLLRTNLWLCAAFVLSTLAAAALLRNVLHDYARNDTIDQARLLMAAAQAARDYTSAEVGPLLAGDGVASPATRTDGAPQSPGGAQAPFHPQSIPAYAAIQIFAALQSKNPQFSYREAALNPTNPRDRALSWEADVIQHFRSSRGVDEIINERTGALGRSLYLAKPIRIDDARCLACHDRASNAPAAVLQKYGATNGFGWQLHETVDAQIVTVPLDAAISGADRAVLLLIGAMTGLFLLTFAVVNVIARQVVLRRITKLVSAAHSISTRHAAQVKLDTTGGDEISALCKSFERMQTSVEKSLALLAHKGQG